MSENVPPSGNAQINVDELIARIAVLEAKAVVAVEVNTQPHDHAPIIVLRRRDGSRIEAAARTTLLVSPVSGSTLSPTEPHASHLRLIPA